MKKVWIFGPDKGKIDTLAKCLEEKGQPIFIIVHMSGGPEQVEPYSLVTYRHPNFSEKLEDWNDIYEKGNIIPFYIGCGEVATTWSEYSTFENETLDFLVQLNLPLRGIDFNDRTVEEIADVIIHDCQQCLQEELEQVANVA